MADVIVITRANLIALRDELVAAGDDPYGLAIVQMALAFGDDLRCTALGEDGASDRAYQILRGHDWNGQG